MNIFYTFFDGDGACSFQTKLKTKVFRVLRLFGAIPYWLIIHFTRQTPQDTVKLKSYTRILKLRFDFSSGTIFSFPATQPLSQGGGLAREVRMSAFVISFMALIEVTI